VPRARRGLPSPNDGQLNSALEPVLGV